MFESPEIGMITPKQYALFMELYAHEDMSLLSAWEVFNMTNDSDDFIDTLFVIEKLEFFHQRIDINEDGMDKTAEKDMTELYKFKKFMPNLTYGALTKMIRAGDFYISGLFSNHKQGMVDFEKTTRFLIEYGEEGRQKIQEKDKKKADFKIAEKADWRIDGMDRIEDFCWRFNFEKTRQEKCLMEAVKKSDPIMESILRVLWLNVDKGDFYENLRTYFQQKLKSKFFSINNKK